MVKNMENQIETGFTRVSKRVYKVLLIRGIFWVAVKKSPHGYIYTYIYIYIYIVDNRISPI